MIGTVYRGLSGARAARYSWGKELKTVVSMGNGPPADT